MDPFAGYLSEIKYYTQCKNWPIYGERANAIARHASGLARSFAVKTRLCALVMAVADG
jgi:hypothetical protein